MTVKELIEVLLELPMDMKVGYFMDEDMYINEIEEVYITNSGVCNDGEPVVELK